MSPACRPGDGSPVELLPLVAAIMFALRRRWHTGSEREAVGAQPSRANGRGQSVSRRDD